MGFLVDSENGTLLTNVNELDFGGKYCKSYERHRVLKRIWKDGKFGGKYSEPVAYHFKYI